MNAEIGLESSGFAGESLVAGKYAKVYVGPEEGGVVIVPLVTKAEQPRKVLIKFFGIDHDWDGKIFINTVKETDKKIEYIMKWEDRDYVSVYAKAEWSDSKTFYCSLPGMKDDIYLLYSKEKTAEIIPQHIVTEYEKQMEENS